MLVLPGWAGMNISLFFGMRVWSFAPLCWSFLHTVSKLDYFWIFGVFVPKGQMGFNFESFLKFGVFYLVLRAALFSRVFLAQCGSWTWMIRLDISQTTIALVCCIGMRVAPVLPTLCSVE